MRPIYATHPVFYEMLDMSLSLTISLFAILASSAEATCSGTGFHVDGSGDCVCDTANNWVGGTKCGKVKIDGDTMYQTDTGWQCPEGEVNLSTFDTVKKINDRVFQHCDKITSVVFPPNLKYIYPAAFEGTKLTEVDLSSNNDLIVMYDSAFHGCEITSVKLPSSITYIGASAFKSNKLTQLRVGAGDFEAFTYDFRGAFFNSAQTYKIKYDAFRDQTLDNGVSIKIIFGEGAAMEIGPTAFKGIPITDNEVDIRNGIVSDTAFTSGVSILYNGCHYGAIKIDTNNDGVVDDNDHCVCNTANNWVGETKCAPMAFEDIYDGSTLIGKRLIRGSNWQKPEGAVDLSSFDFIEIGDNVFQSASGMTSVTFPSTLKVIEGRAFDGSGIEGELDLSGTALTALKTEAFYECASLTSVKFPTTLESIGIYAFTKSGLSKAYSGDGSGTEGRLDLSGLASLTEIKEGAFQQCSNLKSFAFPSILTTMAKSMFAGSGLEGEVNLQQFTTLGQSVFQGTQITSFVLNSDITTIPDSMFKSVETLTGALDLSSYASLTDIGNYAFNRCEGLTSVIFPPNLETIGQSAFYDTRLTGVLDLSGTKVQTIEKSAFSYLLTITEVIFPSTLMTVAENVFDYPDTFDLSLVSQDVTFTSPLSFGLDDSDLKFKVSKDSGAQIHTKLEANGYTVATVETVDCDTGFRSDGEGGCVQGCTIANEEYDTDSEQCVCPSDTHDKLSTGACDPKCNAESEVRDATTEECKCDASKGFEDNGSGGCACTATGFEEVSGNCVPICGANEIRDDQGVCQCSPDAYDKLSTGDCVDKCPSNEERVGDDCLPICETNKARNADGDCVCDASKGFTADADGICVCDVQNNWVGGTKCAPIEIVTWPGYITIVRADDGWTAPAGVLDLSSFTTVQDIYHQVFDGANGITNVIFPPNIQRIRQAAFSNVKNLPDHLDLSGLTKLKEISTAAFNGCQFSKVTFPASFEEVGYYAFNYNDNLAVFDFSLVTQAVTIGTDDSFGPDKDSLTFYVNKATGAQIYSNLVAKSYTLAKVETVDCVDVLQSDGKGGCECPIANEEYDTATGQCVCPDASHDKLSTGACDLNCPSGQERVGDDCLDVCATGQERDVERTCCFNPVSVDLSSRLWNGGYYELAANGYGWSDSNYAVLKLQKSDGSNIDIDRLVFSGTDTMQYSSKLCVSGAWWGPAAGSFDADVGQRITNAQGVTFGDDSEILRNQRSEGDIIFSNCADPTESFQERDGVYGCYCNTETHDELSDGSCLPKCGTFEIRDDTTNECKCDTGYVARSQCPIVATDDWNVNTINGYQLCDAVIDADLVQSCKNECDSDPNCKGFELQHREFDWEASALIAGTQHCHFWGTECTEFIDYREAEYKSYTKASGYKGSAGICAYSGSPQDMELLTDAEGNKKQIDGGAMITSEETCILGCTACVDMCTTAEHALVLKKIHAELSACDSDVSVNDSSEACTTPCMRERCKDADKELISNKYKELVVKKETC